MLKISLQGVPNMVWRRFVVPSFTSLNRLHDIIQKVMGWQQQRSHAFIVRRQYYIPSMNGETLKEAPAKERDGLPEEMFTLDDISFQNGSKFKYVYDPAEAKWVHDIVIESTRYLNPDWPYPVYCLEGVRACPPETCLGIHAFCDLLKILKDPTHPEYPSLVEQCGDFDPDCFSLSAVNKKFKIKMLPVEPRAKGIIPIPEGHELCQVEKPDPFHRLGSLFKKAAS